jgi:hypothetical protein
MPFTIGKTSLADYAGKESSEVGDGGLYFCPRESIWEVGKVHAAPSRAV